jgi:uncharacterized protein (TIGR02466 family)
MNFLNIFSSYLYTKECNINLSSLSDHITKNKKIDNQGIIRSNYGGWQSKNFTKPDSYTKPLFDILNTAAEEIKNKINYQHTLKLQHYWYNINYQDSFNIPHFHIGPHTDTIVSGVFYIETPKDCGKIVFNRKDQLFSLMYHEQRVSKYNEYNSSVWEVTPKENLCVLFPANLEHFVKPNLNKKRRISISFNYGI